jgi:tetratricopeptide (TPR) repeat protein
VKTETAKIELKEGRPVEGPTQLIEVTTYGVKGNRIENTSYPAGGALVGKEEYRYDERGHITEMTVRDDRGAIISREAYSYEFDKFGNWTRMVTSLVVFENGALKREPIEVTYRTVTYYFDDTVAKMVEEPAEFVPGPKAIVAIATAVPEAALTEPAAQGVFQVSLPSFEPELPAALGEPPGLPKLFSLRKEPESFVPAAAAPKTEIATNLALDADQQVAHNFYTAGRNRFDTGDAPGAVELYLQAIKLEAGSAEVHLSLGHAYLKLQKDREALKAFKESIKLNPNVAETHYGFGFSSFRLGRFRDAADAFKKATILEPQMAKAHYGLSLAYQELGNTSGLLDEYRILERLDKSLARKLAQTFPEFNFSCRNARGCP